MVACRCALVVAQAATLTPHFASRFAVADLLPSLHQVASFAALTSLFLVVIVKLAVHISETTTASLMRNAAEHALAPVVAVDILSRVRYL